MTTGLKEQIQFDREHDFSEEISKAERQLTSSSSVSRDKDVFSLSYYLIRSKRREERERGIYLLEILANDSRNNGTELTDYKYTLAYGLFLDDQLSKARRVCQELSQTKNPQVEELLTVIENKIETDGLIGMGVVGGTAAAIGIGLLAGAIALSKRNKK